MATNELRKAIGRNLKMLRKDAGYSSAEKYANHLIELHGEDVITVYKYREYEQGRNPLPFDVAWLIAEDLNITLDELGGRIPPHDDSVMMIVDDEQRELNRSYESMNNSGKQMLVGVAKSLRRDPVNQTLKDGQDNQASGVA